MITQELKGLPIMPPVIMKNVVVYMMGFYGSGKYTIAQEICARSALSAQQAAAEILQHAKHIYGEG